MGMKLTHIATMAVLLACSTILCAVDPFLGKWIMDTKMSKYTVGLPEAMTIEMKETKEGVHYHSETHLRDGISFTADYVARYDGRPVIVSGGKGMLLPVSTKRVSPSEVIAQYTRGGRAVATSHRAVSPDGQTMTITTTSTDGSGNAVTNVGVYRKTIQSKSAARVDTSAQELH